MIGAEDNPVPVEDGRRPDLVEDVQGGDRRIRDHSGVHSGVDKLARLHGLLAGVGRQDLLRDCHSHSVLPSLPPERYGPEDTHVRNGLA